MHSWQGTILEPGGNRTNERCYAAESNPERKAREGFAADQKRKKIRGPSRTRAKKEVITALAGTWEQRRAHGTIGKDEGRRKLNRGLHFPWFVNAQKPPSAAQTGQTDRPQNEGENTPTTMLRSGAAQVTKGEKKKKR